jgi:single-stranded-DNA-specific exonuclease
VVTVDCGAAAHDAIDAAAEIGLEVVVVDHHLMRGDPPRAAAVVNPNRPGCNSGQGSLAAAGVTFVLLAALNREARRRGLFAGRGEPDLLAWLDLAALGRRLRRDHPHGLQPGAGRPRAAGAVRLANPGLKALAEVAKVNPGPTSTFHAGFILGPRINAGGRIGRSDLGARLLSTDDPEEARALAEELDALNVSRKEVERSVFDEAARRLEGAGSAAPVLVVAETGWHPGVIGIVAGRLRERYRKPVIVIGLDPATGIGKGSGRSQPGVNLGRAVSAAYDEGLLLSGGGHAMAAGLTVAAGGVERLIGFLSEHLVDEVQAAGEQDALEVDAVVTARGAGRELWTEFQRLTPFGPGQPEPVFATASAVIEHATEVRGGHVRCTLSDVSGARLRAVAWRSAETELGRRLLARDGALHLAGRLKPDDWQGREGVELEIEDAADPRQCA